jgi:hypothetical protein
MPYDPIERWEWECGALAAELDDPRDARPDAAAEQPDEPAVAADAAVSSAVGGRMPS